MTRTPTSMSDRPLLTADPQAAYTAHAGEIRVAIDRVLAGGSYILGPEVAAFEREFAAIKAISVDYAVMEHATDVVVIEAPFEWDDLGGWQSLARLEGADASGNTIVGRHLGLDTTGTIVHTDDGHLVVTLGLKDCIVVHTPNATLVASKHDEEQIRQVVKELEKHGWTEYL